MGLQKAMVCCFIICTQFCIQASLVGQTKLARGIRMVEETSPLYIALESTNLDTYNHKQHHPSLACEVYVHKVYTCMYLHFELQKSKDLHKDIKDNNTLARASLTAA